MEIKKDDKLHTIPTRHFGPFGELAIGESLFATGTREELYIVQNRAHAYGQGTGFKFKTRLVDGGMRVWRVK